MSDTIPSETNVSDNNASDNTSDAEIPTISGDSDSFEILYSNQLPGGDGSEKTLPFPVAYSCKELLQNNQASQVKIEYYYDLLRNEGDSEIDILRKAETDLLNAVSTNFGLINGARCSVPPINRIWLVRISSWPQDQQVELFDSCYDLVPAEGQACNVYKGTMTGFALGNGDASDIIKFIQNNMKVVPTDGSYQMTFLGTQIDTSAIASSNRDKLPTASSINSFVQSIVPDQAPKVTVLGGFLCAMFALACVGIMMVLFRRRRKWLTAQEVEIALSKSGLDEDMETTAERESQTRKVERHLVEVGSDAVEGDEDDADSPNGRVSAYTFDLGASMKNELFGVHGGKAPRDVLRPVGLGEDLASESDADSWAQTDGTIGSLEQQLEPITAEV